MRRLPVGLRFSRFQGPRGPKKGPISQPSGQSGSLGHRAANRTGRKIAPVGVHGPLVPRRGGPGGASSPSAILTSSRDTGGRQNLRIGLSVGHIAAHRCD